MAVVFDAKVTSTTDSTATVLTVSNTTLTVGSGSNRALIAILEVNHAPLSGLTIAWDPAGANQALTAITWERKLTAIVGIIKSRLRQ